MAGKIKAKLNFLFHFVKHYKKIVLQNNLHLNIFYLMFQQNVKISSRMNANISRPMKDTVTIGKNTWQSGVHSLVDFVNTTLQVKQTVQHQLL